MLPCVFMRINDNIFNANSIKKITIVNEDNEIYDSKHGPIVRIIVLFCDYMDISPMHFYTYYQDIGQMMYDWQHSKASFFEIPYLTLEDLKKET